MVDGDMAIIRLGTCGSPNKELGSIVVSSGSVFVRREPNSWTINQPANYYSISEPVMSSIPLSQLVLLSLSFFNATASKKYEGVCQFV